jgi:hypothetical protein
MQMSAAWIEESGTCVLTVLGAPGQPNLTLLVYPDSAQAVEPWAWEVVETDRPAVRDPLSGSAPTLEVAKAKAMEWADVYSRYGAYQPS